MKKYYLGLVICLIILLGGFTISFSASLRHFSSVESTPFVVDLSGN